MAWKNLASLDSVDLHDLNEYMSRPDERVLELVGRRKDMDIVVYGATGKWMMDITEMLLRALRETGTTRRKVHLVARFSRESGVRQRLAAYDGLYRIHRVDFLNLMMHDLTRINADCSWVIYGIGYKFRTHETEEEYIRLCNLYGKVIPSLIFTYHKKSSDIVMIGSGNALPPSPIDAQAGDDSPLEPLKEQIYGESIKNKEEILKFILEDDDSRSSRAVILRAMYMTNLIYGGLEKPMQAVLRDQPVDLGEGGAFNIIGHRDASIYTILAVQAASNPLTTLNLAGHTVELQSVAQAAARSLDKTVKFTGTPKRLHLLADDSRLKKLFGGPVDSLLDLIAAQMYWIRNQGGSLKLDHKVGLPV